jgi:ribosomal subunit interface protein
MHLLINSRGVEITPARHAYVATKMQHVERRFPHISSCHLLLSADAYAFTIEATVESGGERLAMTATGGNLYEAMDALARQMVVEGGRERAVPADH